MRRILLLVLVVFMVSAGTAVRAGADTRWVPGQGLRWQYQLQGVVKVNVCGKPLGQTTCVQPDVYDIDLYNNTGTALNTAAVSAIHARGAHAICYVDAGSWENFRPDQAAFPADVLGRSNGWPGEKWLDIRRTDVLLPIMSARVAKCVQAGFDAVEFDNVDGYTNNTGFPLTAADQMTFDVALAGIAHDNNLSVGLKNAIDLLGPLQNTFDFAINEQCFQYQECAAYDAWTTAGKAVLEVEYKGTIKKYCADASLHNRDAIHKALALKAAWKPCK